MARTLHNIGLQVGLAVASGVPECRTAFTVLLGVAEPSPADECRPLLSTLVSMVSQMPAGHLSLEAGMTCMPYKMRTLRLIKAVCDGEHDRIREVHESLADHDSAARALEDEVGWRQLSRAVIASAVSMMLRRA
ncbi:hypothetical protein [Streptomyces sp. NPDC050485]|uniref:hypothetical protein n=1 Tax=Streptomyces sp. NPDC050485 TaxID=3365617 RepID=UPI00379BA28D